VTPVRAVVVMGVAGCGKSTVAALLAERLGWELLEGDGLHPATNVERMSAGVPLTDDDRAPWLAAIAEWMRERLDAGRPVVVACSALARRYRDVLRRDDVLFLHLSGRITKYELYTVLAIVFLHIWLFLPYPAFFACLFAVLCILFLTNYHNRFLSWIGKISYSIYLIHAIVGLAAINVMSRFAHTGIMKFAVILAGAGITILVSYCMYLWVEKPSQKLSSKIKL